MRRLEENGPGAGFQVDPNGGSYFCDFTSMGSGWDLLPGQNVGVQYQEPDGDQVINVFHAPAANVRIEKWAAGGGQAMPGGAVLFDLRYRNEGDAVAATIILTDTLPSNTTYVSDSSGVTPTVGLHSVVWMLGPLGPGEERQFQLVLSNTAQLDDVLVNSADIWTLYDQEPGTTTPRRRSVSPRACPTCTSARTPTPAIRPPARPCCGRSTTATTGRSPAGG